MVNEFVLAAIKSRAFQFLSYLTSSQQQQFPRKMLGAAEAQQVTVTKANTPRRSITHVRINPKRTLESKLYLGQNLWGSNNKKKEGTQFSGEL